VEDNINALGGAWVLLLSMLVGVLFGIGVDDDGADAIKGVSR
jgi:hypothetical protein